MNILLFEMFYISKCRSIAYALFSLLFSNADISFPNCFAFPSKWQGCPVKLFLNLAMTHSKPLNYFFQHYENIPLYFYIWWSFGQVELKASEPWLIMFSEFYQKVLNYSAERKQTCKIHVVKNIYGLCEHLLLLKQKKLFTQKKPCSLPDFRE